MARCLTISEPILTAGDYWHQAQWNLTENAHDMLATLHFKYLMHLVGSNESSFARFLTDFTRMYFAVNSANSLINKIISPSVPPRLINNLPVSHLSPTQPVLQAHENWSVPTPCVQLPPFTHGSLEHSLTSEGGNTCALKVPRYITRSRIPVKLPWIFLGAPLIFQWGSRKFPG